MDEPEGRQPPEQSTAASGAGDAQAPRPPVAMNRAREQAVDRLRAHYVRDDIDVEMYESMVDVAWAAQDPADLEELFSRLPALPEQEGALAEAGQAHPAPALASAGEQKEQGFQLAFMSGNERKGSWVPPKKLYSLAVMGGSGLDFREARLGPGLTEVTIVAVMGGVDVIVPPGITVEAHGFGIMGGFDGHSQTVDSSDPSAPVLRIRGLAVMGGIDVRMMLPGETSRDARRRVKEGRRRRRLERGKGRDDQETDVS